MIRESDLLQMTLVTIIFHVLLPCLEVWFFERVSFGLILVTGSAVKGKLLPMSVPMPIPINISKSSRIMAPSTYFVSRIVGTSLELHILQLEWRKKRLPLLLFLYAPSSILRYCHVHLLLYSYRCCLQSCLNHSARKITGGLVVKQLTQLHLHNEVWDLQKWLTASC